jgi:hypothetical protein
MSRALAIVALAIVIVLVGDPSAPSRGLAAGPFTDWAGVVVAGDFHAHSGAPSEAFDNARRDVARAFEDAGFQPQNIRQFSVRPERYPEEHLMLSDPGLISSQLTDLASRVKGGCLVYFTSHGSPAGVVIGPRLLSPPGLSRIVDDACGTRPTVVIISACFSGVFVPPLSDPDHMVMTAARPDRSSFGCGEADRYPYFDACLLDTLPHAKDFTDLASRAQACVAAKEKATGMAPPSEPQVFVGSQFRPLAPFYPFAMRQASASGELSRGRPAP